MKRWDSEKCEDVEMPEIDNFLEGIAKVCKAYNMSLSHEDTHGAFVVVPYSVDNERWLMDAHFNFGNIQ